MLVYVMESGMEKLQQNDNTEWKWISVYCLNACPWSSCEPFNLLFSEAAF